MTTIKVDWYKSSGKWYADRIWEGQNINVWESLKIEEMIERSGTVVSEMSYTYEASSTEGINKRMVIKSQN